MPVLLIAEHSNTNLSDATAKALTAALAIDGEVDILVAGRNATGAAAEAAGLQGVREVLLAESDTLENQLAEPLAALIVSLAPGYSALLSPATSTSKSVMPRVAALLDVMQVSDVVAVVARDTFKRPIYAGNAIQTVQVTDAPTVATIRATAFAATPSGASVAVRNIAVDAAPPLSTFISRTSAGSDLPELTSAKIVISGGRGFGSQEKFDALLRPLAAKLGAALGASRAAVDAGFAPSDWQVGQTGKAVAPDLYIAIGISGAIQHLAGMKESRVIVAINRDENAPIFQIADYALVGDLFEIVPELERSL